MDNRKRKPLMIFAVIFALALGVGLVYGGYVDASALAAAPLLFAVGDITTAPAKLLRELQSKRDSLVKAAAAITGAVAEGAGLTAEQNTAIDKHLADIKGLDVEITRLSALVEASRAAPLTGTIVATRENILDDPRRGFATFGEFAMSVRDAGLRNHAIDERLVIGAAAPGATYSNENIGADGGYLVPTEFASRIAELSLDHDAFLPRCDSYPIQGNSITYISDETTPWGTNGVRAYWAAEAAAATATKPIVKPNTMRLNKLIALVPVTDEMLADGPYLGAKLVKLMGRSIKWKTNDAIVNGTGAGQPLGFSKGGALVVVNKEGGQAASTVLPANVAKMYAAMPADYLAGAEWLIAPDALPQLMTMVLGNQAIWTPPSEGFKQAPGGFLFGRPISLSQTNQALSAQGDIYFVNFSAYETISKDGVQIAQSMHLYFDADSTAFRATFRIDGQPTFKAPIVQARGAQNLSPYVTLQNR